MSTEPYMQYEHESGVVARWHGGEYIDLGSLQSMGQPGIDGDDFHAYDVINVWDHAEGKPRIPRTLDALRDAVDERLADLDDDRAERAAGDDGASEDAFWDRLSRRDEIMFGDGREDDPQGGDPNF